MQRQTPVQRQTPAQRQTPHALLADLPTSPAAVVCTFRGLGPLCQPAGSWSTLSPASLLEDPPLCVRKGEMGS